MTTYVVGHQNMDFDSVSSMVAVNRLYPGAGLLLQPTVEGTVREFLNLYRGQFGFRRFQGSPPEPPETLIVVDTNNRNRLGPFESWVDRVEHVILYDHHPAADASFTPDESYVDTEVGALITSMVLRMREQHLEPTELEATLFMLGLHQETGSLQFGTTTDRDYEVGSYLMRHEADLDVVQQFYQSYLDEDQRSLFVDLLEGLQDREINGYRISFATAQVGQYVPEIALISHKLRDAENLNVLISLVKMGDRVQGVFRSRVDGVDVGEMARAFGGGGHPRAASATLKDYDLEEARQAIEQWMLNNLRTGIQARDLMSSPVHTVRPDLPVKEAQRVMLRLGHGGLPVTEETGELVGVITRSDVDQAVQHELTHAPVKGFMNPDVITAKPNDNLMDLKNTIIRNQVGRLPVVKDDHLLGIVTRSDIITALHDRELVEGGRPGFREVPVRSEPRSSNVSDQLRNYFQQHWLERLREWGRIVDEWDDSIYLVGGCVRDLIMDRSVQDLDFVVEGDGLRFARYLDEKENAEVSIHETFRTAVVQLSNGQAVDIATARSEYYSQPAALPEVDVEQTSMRQDLRRRDFTINAMAVDLSPDQFGDLLDPFGGEEDLQQGLIRVLHGVSFRDDPTRILRAFEFAGRFNFDLEEATEHYLNQSLTPRTFDPVSGDRIREQFDRILKRRERVTILERLESAGVMEALHENLSVPDGFSDASSTAQELVQKYQPKRPVMVYYCLLFKELSEPTREFLARRWNFSRERRDILDGFMGLMQSIDRLREASDNSAIYRLLEPYDHWEPLLAVFSLSEDEIRRKIQLFLDDLVRETPLVDGEDLKRWGIDPGPQLGDLLMELFDYQLDHSTSDRDELIDYLRQNYPGLLDLDPVTEDAS